MSMNENLAYCASGTCRGPCTICGAPAQQPSHSDCREDHKNLRCRLNDRGVQKMKSGVVPAFAAALLSAMTWWTRDSNSASSYTHFPARTMPRLCKNVKSWPKRSAQSAQSAAVRIVCTYRQERWRSGESRCSQARSGGRAPAGPCQACLLQGTCPTDRSFRFCRRRVRWCCRLRRR